MAGVTFAVVWALVFSAEPLWFEVDEAVTGWIESVRTAWVADIADVYKTCRERGMIYEPPNGKVAFASGGR